MTRAAARYQRSFQTFTLGQKVTAIVGTGALLLGAFLVFRWVSAPNYSPLFSDLSSADASAVLEQLDASGVPYELTDGGSTVLVPRDAVYKTRIDLSADGLPSNSGGGGYSLLDDQGLSTSNFQEQTDFKRAMEGELANTIEAIDGVDAAVVHLAMPEKSVFADEQQPTTASVLIGTRTGSTISPSQVQAIVHLVASSIEGLSPDDVTVTDSAGTLLTANGAQGDATARGDERAAIERELQAKIQSQLDRIVGPGNSTVQTNVVLNFDKRSRQEVDYTPDERPSSSTTSTENYTGTGAGSVAGGVVGPDGQMENGLGSNDPGATYTQNTTTADHPVDSIIETTETAPGQIEKLNVSVVLDAATTQAYSPTQVRKQLADGIGIDPANLAVSAMPFNRTAEETAQKELAAQRAADEAAAKNDLYRKGGLGLAVLAMVLLALLQGRRKAKRREQATTYVVEQLKLENAARTTAIEAPAALALEEAERSEDDLLRAELDALIERQPEDVAALLRGWLTEKN
ncbi:flagellar basal-body MS-ring/collar protein FliF [Nocardioides sp. R-C-SC26]|uniref:flagellar basal-body MS-ring/collar protein FliF n=1 Tax=Nocardioides sp. R-C-SC26 TaxID=2870414 RepID=UPI001E314AFC|nr:flagellar basal-body MS-ring/collar protein FliF [Nocardioides sp. R-C-SC26]